MRDFKVEDFDGSGQYIVRLKDDEKCTDTGFLTTVMYKIGYMYRGARDVHTLYKISIADGWIQDGYKRDDEWIYWEGTIENKTETHSCKAKFVEYLNDPTLCEQEYRFATQEEVVRAVMSQSHRWRN